MSDAFRELLKKIGSGPHTGENLSRTEAAAAVKMMLLGEATPAQIGAFMIAHRIKRPTGEELAGMLDAWEEFGPRLSPLPPESGFTRPVTVLGIPYDGRSRTAPLSPLTALILTAAGVPVILHGSGRMPTKEGIPLVEIWQGLGVDWTTPSLEQVQQVFATTGLGFVYQGRHFPQAEQLVTYRREIGKRPPFATMELMACPYAGEVHLVCGYVHPPTETMFQEALTLRGVKQLTTVKGLEGSCDLPRDRTAIIGIARGEMPFERLFLACGDYGFSHKNPSLESSARLIEQMQSVLRGESSELMQSAIWNGGFYLWCCGISADVAAGFSQAESLLTGGEVAKKIEEIIQCLRR